MKLLLPFVLLAFSTAWGAEWKTSFGGDVELSGIYLPKQVVVNEKKFRGIGTIKLPSSIRYGRAWRLRLLPVFQADPDSLSKRERYYIDPQEAYLQWQGLPWTVQLGYNVFQWGDTDLFNPLDVVNPRRYFDPLRSEKMGSPALLVKRDFESFFAEAVYIPLQSKTRLPGEKSRWLPRDIYRSRSIESAYGTNRILLPANLNYQYVGELKLNNALEHNFGARFKFRFSGFDWTVAGFQGVAPTPYVGIRAIQLAAAAVYLPELTLQVQPDVYLRASYYKSRMVGTSFSWVLGDFLMKGATAYSKPLSDMVDLPKKSWENVLGLERTFSPGSHSITMLAQGTYVNRSDRLDTNSVSFARMFDSSALLGARWVPHERWTILASYLRDFKFNGSLMHDEISFKLKDAWKLKFSADILAGKTETPIGTYANNDRFDLSLNVQW